MKIPEDEQHIIINAYMYILSYSACPCYTYT